MKNSPSNKSGQRWVLLYAIDNGDHFGFFLGLPRHASLLLRSILQQTLEAIRKMWRIPSDKSNFAKASWKPMWFHLLSSSTLFGQESLQRLQTAKNPTLLQTTEIDIIRFFNEHVKCS